jgi:hypothetical protein
MHEVGRDKLLPKVNAEKDGIALFIAGFGAEESDWLVFPDRRMILWRYWQTPIYGKPSLLKFGLANFDAKPCARVKNNFLHCVGAAFPPKAFCGTRSSRVILAETGKAPHSKGFPAVVSLEHAILASTRGRSPDRFGLGTEAEC